MGAEAQTEHDRRGPDEEVFTLLGGEQVASDDLNPAISAKFDRYEIERSDGGKFNKLGQISAVNAKNYNYTDFS